MRETLLRARRMSLGSRSSWRLYNTQIMIYIDSLGGGRYTSHLAAQRQASRSQFWHHQKGESNFCLHMTHKLCYMDFRKSLSEFGYVVYVKAHILKRESFGSQQHSPRTQNVGALFLTRDLPHSPRRWFVTSYSVWRVRERRQRHPCIFRQSHRLKEKDEKPRLERRPTTSRSLSKYAWSTPTRAIIT